MNEFVERLQKVHNDVGSQIDRISMMADNNNADFDTLDKLLARINKMMAETQSILDELER